MCDRENSAISVRKRHSVYTNPSSVRYSSRGVCKSEANISYVIDTAMAENKYLTRSDVKLETSREYYKNYDHDEIPVKDESSFDDHSFDEDNDFRTEDNKDSITNSDLDKLEYKILKKMSKELQTDDSSVSNLDSNIKLFKTTVQQIFDNFYIGMQDFEDYKKKFYEILEKNKGDLISEMEVFIRDIIRNIGSSESSISNKKITEKSPEETKQILSKKYGINIYNNSNIKSNESNSLNSTMETFLNEDYLADYTDNNSSTDVKGEETCNIYPFGGTPCVDIKMNIRDMFSEINIRDQNVDRIVGQLASAENIEKLTAKKLQLKEYAKQQHRCHASDRNIPVRVFNAKKNIHLDEDFVCDEKEESRFFIFKMCNYICRKFRRNTFV